MLSGSGYTRRSIVDILSGFLPVAASCFVPRIILTLFASLDNQISVLFVGIVFLIPLILIVTDKSIFKVPVVLVDFTILIELFLPYQFIVFLIAFRLFGGLGYFIFGGRNDLP